MKSDIIQTERCQECNQQKPAFNFTYLTIQDDQSAKCLCSKCYNRYATSIAGIDDLEISEFDPIILADANGVKRKFHFNVRFSTGLGISAFELINGHPGGYMFSVFDDIETQTREAYSKLIDKIKKGLSTIYLKLTEFDHGQKSLYLKHSAANGRIEESDDGSILAVIDGVEYTWEEFGRSLSAHMGFNFRLEIYDPSDEMDISNRPRRANLKR